MTFFKIIDRKKNLFDHFFMTFLTKELVDHFYDFFGKLFSIFDIFITFFKIIDRKKDFFDHFYDFFDQKKTF